MMLAANCVSVGREMILIATESRLHADNLQWMVLARLTVECPCEIPQGSNNQRDAKSIV